MQPTLEAMTEMQTLLGEMGLTPGRGRRAAGVLTCADVGLLMGLTPATLSRYMQGAAPSASVLRLARLLAQRMRPGTPGPSSS